MFQGCGLGTMVTVDVSGIDYDSAMRVCKPPLEFVASAMERVVFLAGPIDHGQADWQATLTDALRDLNLVVLNPRGEVPDAKCEQSVDNAAFVDQMQWELDGLERANQIAVWFAAGSRAPKALLELGLHARSGKVVVGCPLEFWSRGNVELVCERFLIPLATGWDDFVATLRASISTSRAD
jgi:hypothetical protein